MNGFRDDDFGERLSKAAKAKQAALEKFKAKVGQNDPASIERQKARQAISAAREVRAAERKAAKEAELIRLAAEKAAAEAAAAQAAIEEAARKVALEAEQKAARDARYAARKARR
jgi:type II secretory pathway component PulM